jgi:hypothetical protein
MKQSLQRATHDSAICYRMTAIAIYTLHAPERIVPSTADCTITTPESLRTRRDVEASRAVATIERSKKESVTVLWTAVCVHSAPLTTWRRENSSQDHIATSHVEEASVTLGEFRGRRMPPRLQLTANQREWAGCMTAGWTTWRRCRDAKHPQHAPCGGLLC